MDSLVTRIGVGIVGFAHGHVDAYCRAWAQNHDLGIEVIAGWDHDQERLSAAGTTHGIETYSDIDKLLGQVSIQAVVIAAETSMHAELVEKVASHHKAIILQKPMATTLSDSDRIVKAVARHDVPFTMAWQMRVDPQNLKIKALVDSGQFGRLFMVRRRHGLPTHQWPEFGESWHVDSRMNRDIWADDAAHPIDFLHWLLGVPETVTAEIESLLDPKVPMDNGIAVFRYQDGPIAEISCSFTCSAAENTTEVIAENGTIIQNYGDVPSCNAPRPGDAEGLRWFLTAENRWTPSGIASPTNHGTRIADLAKPLAEFLHKERGPIATAQEGRTSLMMTLACYVSAREGRRVRLDECATTQI
ncbi:MAG: Gfo/Idh/MocA family oxidoreductase [Candidatus Latescibacteria bacterium]|jgi:predicted dehydrogenase|nr:Gfo/Idh/MocA family oxidoreductase [Candidatus Latescibacterota bacterium]